MVTLPRVQAIDTVRGFAIFAMVVAHTAYFTRDFSPYPYRAAESLLNDVAAPLFALIIGVTITVTAPYLCRTDGGAGVGEVIVAATREAGDARGRDGSGEASADSQLFRLQKRRYLKRTAVKALALILLGFLLEIGNMRIDIVLDYLGFALLITLPFIFRRTRTLILWVVLLALLGPIAVSYTTTHMPVWFWQFQLEHPWVLYVAQWVTLGSNYRLMGILLMFLLGIVVGRTCLRSRSRLQRLAIASLVVFILVQIWVAFDMPGTGVDGGYVEIVRDAAMSMLALTVIWLLMSARVGGAKSVWVTVLEPLTAQGRMALSVYAFHVLVLTAVGVMTMRDSGHTLLLSPLFGWVVQLGLIIACWVFAAAWWRWLGPGPIERLVKVITQPLR